ncbi:BLUF domain-containing protein [Luteimonas aestuarii]|uniref:BLUF domain-containing protein n=1 Tax=Luteimonas aestuarii TaxID=453837 RepID=A0A4R5TTS7_9GAMM|nr:BLUF domain-containing protein [Luteimonas aestuarii]TDK24422.1 BLUF domain-containing protein [Luteimonas aestuarii]
MIRRLLYRSRQAYEFGTDDLLRLLLAARRYNGAQGVTGLLLFREGLFMQLLEGARTDVEMLYARIAQDPRHREVEMLQIADGVERMMPGWQMGYAQAPQIDGKDVFSGLVTDAGALQLLARAGDRSSGIAATMRGFLAGEGAPPAPGVATR